MKIDILSKTNARIKRYIRSCIEKKFSKDLFAESTQVSVLQNNAKLKESFFSIDVLFLLK